MDKILTDKRFKQIATDPRFKNVPRKEKKIKIDKRFQAMFTDKRFQLKYAVDSRGRQLDELQTENYKKYYDLSDSSEGLSSASENEDEQKSEHLIIADTKVENKLSEDSDGGENTQDKPSPEKKVTLIDEPEKKLREKEKRKEAVQVVNRYIDEVHKKTLINEKVREKLEDVTVDYARGIGRLLSESSSDESTSEDSDVEDIEHAWGELDMDAERTEEVTSRLAVCNLDWDRVSAKDLMVLFHSFLPPTGLIHSINVYPSEFGLARMKEEELKGPKELVEHNKEVILEPEEENETEEGSEYQREKLREYQLKRLRYFYAVVVCSNPQTASLLYTECDGWEFESSATRLDLRFIPDGEVFQHKPRDVCTVLPDLKKYKPRLFINKALQQGKVELTWDETDPNRIEFNRKIFEKSEKLDENDLQSFIASASSEDSDENEGNDEDHDKSSENESEEKSKKGGKDTISKYRSLISHLKKEEDKKSKMSKFVDSDEGKKEGSEKEEDADSGRSQSDSDTDSSSDEIVSDDSEKPSRKRGQEMKQNAKKVKTKSKKKQEKDENCEDEKAKAELELLLCDTNNTEMDRRHFSLEKIQKEEKENKKKRKWKRKKKDDYKEEDPFKLDLSDDRFSAIYTSHHFNIDPADPHFRKTKAMEDLIAEKQKRRRLHDPSQ